MAFFRYLIPLHHLTHAVLLGGLAVLGGSSALADDKPLEIHGFASIGYLSSSANNFLAKSSKGSFQFNEIAINASKQIDDDVRVGMQLFSRDLGDIGNNDITLDWAYVDYRPRQELGFRIGKFKLPLGLYNDIQDYDLLRTSILLPQSVYNLSWRETMVAAKGANAYGNFGLGKMGDLDYQLFIGPTTVSNDGGVAKMLLNNDHLTLQDTEIRNLYGASLKWNTPVEGLLFATAGLRTHLTFNGTMDAYYLSPANIPQNQIGATMQIDMPQYLMSFTSAQYTYNDLVLTAEYRRERAENKQIISWAIPALGRSGESSGIGRDTSGYYFQASYRLNKQFEVGSYYAVDYHSRRDKDGKILVQSHPGSSDYQAWTRDLAFSLRYDITDYWLVKAEWHRMDGASYLLMSDNPGGLQKDWNLLALKTSISF